MVRSTKMGVGTTTPRLCISPSPLNESVGKDNWSQILGQELTPKLTLNVPRTHSVCQLQEVSCEQRRQQSLWNDRDFRERQLQQEYKKGQVTYSKCKLTPGYNDPPLWNTINSPRHKISAAGVCLLWCQTESSSDHCGSWCPGTTSSLV